MLFINRGQPLLFQNWLRETDSHRRSLGYEPSEILLLHPAITLFIPLLYYCSLCWSMILAILVGGVGIEPTFAALSRQCLRVYKARP